MDIKQQIEENRLLREKYENLKSRRDKLEPIRNLKAKEAKEILNKFGISDIRDWKKLADLRDEKVKESIVVGNKIRECLEKTEPKIEEVENILAE